MRASETAKILAVLAAAYPRFEVSETTHTVWQEMLADLDYAGVDLAARRYIATSKFPPSITEIRQALVPEGLAPAEAWGLLMGAIHHFGYYRETEALASLPPEVVRVVCMVGWREVNMSTELDVIRGQFLRMYQQVAERARREALLPPWLQPGEPQEPREAIAALATRKTLGGTA
jgi:hypothetical protein